jgi:hypothetical protein
MTKIQMAVTAFRLDISVARTDISIGDKAQNGLSLGLINGVQSSICVIKPWTLTRLTIMNR